MKTLGFGAFFWIIGVGCGLLANHFLNNKPHNTDQQPISIPPLDDSAVMLAAVFTQAAESLRHTVQVLICANIAGLAACAAIVASTGHVSAYIYIAALAFVAGLVGAHRPGARLSDEYLDDVAATLAAMKPRPSDPTRLSYSLVAHHKRKPRLFSLICLGIGLVALIAALALARLH